MVEQSVLSSCMVGVVSIGDLQRHTYITVRQGEEKEYKGKKIKQALLLSL